jgi:hypothetical protein
MMIKVHYTVFVVAALLDARAGLPSTEETRMRERMTILPLLGYITIKQTFSSIPE